MSNFQKISSAVLLLAAGLGLTACEQNAPSEGNCITYPENYGDPCEPNAPKKDKRYCFGEDFICLKDEPSKEFGGSRW